MRLMRRAAMLLAGVGVIAACAENPTAPSNITRPQADLSSAGGLIHFWTGDGNAADGVGGANGSLGWAASFATGLHGQAFQFNYNQGSIVSLPVNIGPAALPRMTMGMWVNLSDEWWWYENLGWALGHDDGGYDRSLALTDYRYGYGVAGGTGVDPHASSLLQLINEPNSWHCVAVAYDAPSRTATFYADGATQTVYANPGEGMPNATLGGLQNYGGHTFDGLVDDVFMYDKVLSKDEMDAACQLGATPPATINMIVNQTTLWPVNHKMITVAHVSATAPLTITVTATEPANSNDWLVVRNSDGTYNVQLRAERLGTETDRVYTIVATAKNIIGTVTTQSAKVTVPHDQRK